MTPQSGPRLGRIRIDARATIGSSRSDAGRGAPDSLMLCLQAVLRVYGREVPYDELLALAPRRTEGGPEMPRDAAGQHAFLVEAAKRFGLEVRELHPPDATPLPPTPREFDWHFRDSYLPFIRTALERDEPVLAWMGWPPPDAREWGIIASLDPATGTCSGWTASGRRELIAAPVQVYTAAPFAG
jgi:hypothetical protein